MRSACEAWPRRQKSSGGASRTTTRAPLPRWAGKLVRLLYLARAEGDAPIASAIERINAIERAEKQRIVLKEAKNGWASKFEPHEATDCEVT
jgi:hypothetical protein